MTESTPLTPELYNRALECLERERSDHANTTARYVANSEAMLAYKAEADALRKERDEANELARSMAKLYESESEECTLQQDRNVDLREALAASEKHNAELLAALEQVKTATFAADSEQPLANIYVICEAAIAATATPAEQKGGI